MDSSNTPWLMFGLACSMPWNAMITSTNFYEQELANRHDLFNIFESGISVCYLACNLISFIVIQVMGPPRHAVAIRGFISFNLVVFTLLTLVSLVDPDGLEVFVFSLVLVSAIGLGALSAAYRALLSCAACSWR